MENFWDDLNLPDLNNSFSESCPLDINKILVILLILTGRLQIESIIVYPNDFAVTLGTFKII